ncbi:DsbA family protein [Pseudaestuariivita atlantica]|uniref:Thiol-disulfide oxidoreductase n=1 Tax=Pseudaestuariivita atlantica TaxID=1317121 RepID=A0A0L1JQ45_9RHOB|nr:DsbA family protein [Pseudaestuariivita atlantica]KNG93890.1 thiol-disulfide oxidoreductase [Pseudaestuariivita atlantica]
MNRLFYVAVFAIALIAGGGWKLLQPSPEQVASGAFPLPGAAMAQETTATDDDAAAPEIMEMVLGAEDAPVEIIEYASYTCPHCGNFHNGPYKQLKADYIDTGKVRFVYREVYFDRYGVWASMIARCAGTQEAFFGITDMLYETQSSWSRAGSDAAIADELRKIGRVAGISADQMEACLTDGDKVRALVEWFRANATEHNIDSTPSFVINGTKYANMPYDEMSALIEEGL